MPKIEDYYTDDYPREGCRLEVLVSEGRYKLRVYAPGIDRCIESYAYVDTPEDIGRMVSEWCNGNKPRL